MATTPQQRKAAAIADLMAGESPQVIAERYGFKPATVRAWKKRALPRLMSPEMARLALVSTAPEQATIGEQVVALLAAKLRASTAIAQAVSDPAWLATQSGNDLAALGDWLDSTAFAIGDRLATHTRRTE